MRDFRIIIAAVLGLLLVSTAVGKDAERLLAAGAVRSHELTEEFRMSVGVTARGEPARRREFVQEREVVNVPEHFGTLIHIATDGNRTVLWYESSRGRLRNVILDGTAEQLVAVQVMPVTSLELDAHK